MLDGKAAYALGLADAMFDGADFLERSLDWAGQVVSGTTTVERAPVDRDADRWDAVLADARAFVDTSRREPRRLRTRPWSCWPPPGRQTASRRSRRRTRPWPT